MQIGVISDTHGLLRPEAIEVLRGCDQILHAGDIGDPTILERLAELAPLAAIRGNNDTAPWATDLPEELTLELAGQRLLMLHDLKDLGLDPATAGLAVVVSGHSHKPALTRRDGVLYLNPGSAGRRRFSLPIAVAILHLTPTSVAAEVLQLEAGEWRRILGI